MLGGRHGAEMSQRGRSPKLTRCDKFSVFSRAPALVATGGPCPTRCDLHTTIKQCLGLGLRTLGGRHGAEISIPGSIAENDEARRVFGLQSCASPRCNGRTVSCTLPLSPAGNSEYATLFFLRDCSWRPVLIACLVSAGNATSRAGEERLWAQRGLKDGFPAHQRQSGILYRL